MAVQICSNCNKAMVESKEGKVPPKEDGTRFILYECKSGKCKGFMKIIKVKPKI